jgi:cytidine deaminase
VAKALDVPLSSLVGHGVVAQVGLDVVLASAPPSLLQFSRSPGSRRRWRTWPIARVSRWTPCVSGYWFACRVGQGRTHPCWWAGPGVNVFHFTGGPCAESMAIGAAAGAGAEPLITIVAVGDGERCVIATCDVAARSSSDCTRTSTPSCPRTVSCDPAPFAIYSPAATTARTPQTDGGSSISIPAASTASSPGEIRLWSASVIPCTWDQRFFSFDDEHTVRRLDGEVKRVNTRKVATLTDDAHREDLEDRDLFLAALSEHYPNLEGNDVVDVVTFQIVKP